MVQQAWHFRDERRVSIDPPLLDPATWQEKPGERTLSDRAETTPGSDARGLPHDPRGGADRSRGTIRPEAPEEVSSPPREDDP